MSLKVTGNKVVFEDEIRGKRVVVETEVKGCNFTRCIEKRFDIVIYDADEVILNAHLYELKNVMYSNDYCIFSTYMNDFPKSTHKGRGNTGLQTSTKSMKTYLKEKFDVDLKEYEKMARSVLKGWCG